jgi:hypothetical protein
MAAKCRRSTRYKVVGSLQGGLFEGPARQACSARKARHFALPQRLEVGHDDDPTSGPKRCGRRTRGHMTLLSQNTARGTMTGNGEGSGHLQQFGSRCNASEEQPARSADARERRARGLEERVRSLTHPAAGRSRAATEQAAAGRGRERNFARDPAKAPEADDGPAAMQLRCRPSRGNSGAWKAAWNPRRRRRAP